MPRRLMSRLCRLACETERKLNADPPAAFAFAQARNRLRQGCGAQEAGHYVLCAVGLYAVVAVILLAAPSRATAQPEPSPTTAGEARAGETQTAAEKPAAAETEEGEHQEGVVPVVARLVNFAIFIGALIYLLRSPLATYVNNRDTQIRSDLVNAARMKQTAGAQLDELDRKMKALPGELEALGAQGAQEIAAEEARIRAAAAAERDRLLEQARRDIDHQVKVAERELVNHAADLAVGVAAARIKKTITDDDQRRLADRYVRQLKR